jgi:PTS system mannose-specific IID component
MDKKLQFKIFIRSLFLQVGWNFKGMQNIGFAFSMFPVLEKIYKKDDLNKAVLRHLQYFNTNPYMVGFTLGLCTNMEQKKVESEKIENLKQALSTATAAIGDRFFWAVLKPFTLALILCFVVVLKPDILSSSTKDMQVVLFALIFGFLFYNFFVLYIRWNSIAYGYKCAEDKYCGMDFINWNKAIKKMKILGLFLTILFGGICLAKYTYFVTGLIVGTFYKL